MTGGIYSRKHHRRGYHQREHHQHSQNLRELIEELLQYSQDRRQTPNNPLPDSVGTYKH